MINPRQERILAAIVEEYVETAEPVASKHLVEQHGIDVSSATVRNDMAALEAAGLLRQPHTSAGRIPTEEGYRYYLDRFVRKSKTPAVRVRLTIKTSPMPTDNFRGYMRQLAKSLVQLTGEAAFVSEEDGWHFYTGITNLFEKPEFGDVAAMRALSGVIERFDDLVRNSSDRLTNDVNVWIGAENPFGEDMATIMVKYQNPKSTQGVLGLVGPLRMNYAKNMKLLAEARRVLMSRI